LNVAALQARKSINDINQGETHGYARVNDGVRLRHKSEN